MDRVGEARIRLYGDTAVLTVRATNTAHYEGRRFDADEWTTEVFVRRNGQWLCVFGFAGWPGDIRRGTDPWL